MGGSYNKVREHRGRMVAALISLQKKPLDETPLWGLKTPLSEGTGDADVEDRTSPREVDEAAIKLELKNTIQDDNNMGDNKLDVNEFVIEALLKCNIINYEKNLEPILNHLRGVRIGADGLVDREEISKFYNTQEQQPSDSPIGNGSYNPLYRINSRGINSQGNSPSRDNSPIRSDSEEKERNI
eukprot:CAMPEP_0119046896 /NCGR_PEP_ID=MMETSP1177-20130426/49620_1 /TAXON_ID=2985 /ORGANISM="Ochromonas sp, Strain CCMP1899" /LENGTH=183 /DNA_ID=CAMNT_0007020677 /DNA_START=707 /DNA_END=1258 /DNA_ORIENTATION=+